ncbi:MAG: hydrogen peroxide-inducible genes activator [Verrucomicrobiota bacterium]
MEIHQLRYVAMVARTHNFCRAAELCHITQPSLSQQIKKLENELGERIFERSRRGATLTRFGRRLLPKIQASLSSLQDLENLAHDQEQEVAGELTFGAIPTIAPYFMPPLVQACAKAHPGMQLQLVENTTETLVEKLLAGEIDCAMMSRPHPHEQLLETRTLFQEPFLIVLASRHPLAKRKRLRLPELAGTPMIIMQEMHSLNQQIRALCEASNARPKLSVKSAQIETMVYLVEAGLGYSLIPEMAAQSMEHRDVVFRHVISEDAHRDVILAWPRALPLNRLMTAFLGVLAAWQKAN